MTVIYITLFGMLGVLCRYGVYQFVEKNSVFGFPLATFIINILGAFLIGIVFVLGVEKLALSPPIRIGVMVGFLGGFTTFSSYCMDTLRLIEQSQFKLASIYFLMSPILGMIAVFGGVMLARRF